MLLIFGLRVQGLGIYWGYLGMMEKKMETTLVAMYLVISLGVILGLYLAYMGIIGVI